jgi:hypothetical protein
MVVVYCEPQEQLCRLIARDRISETAARARIDAQMPPDEKRGFGHFVVDASDTLADTDARADEVIAALRAVAAGPPAQVPIAAARALAMMERGPREGPRGLTAWGCADRIAAEGTLDLAHLATDLRPAHIGPWYEAPATAPPGHPPETLAVPVAVWCAGRRPGDFAFTASAAASLARLTHRDGGPVAGAIVAALAAQHALGGREGPALRQGVRQWVAEATAWTGSAPPSSVVDTVLAAATHPGERERAARAAHVAGGIPALARALAGGPPPAPVPSDRLECVARILGAAGV